MLASTERSFSIDATGCTVKLCNGITVHSTSTVAEIFGPNNDRLGYLATASPLGETLGLKAICVNPGHKVKGSTPCQCWVRYSKKKDISSDDRVDLFKSLCQWVAEGTTMVRDEHMDYSFTIREAAGMNPRRLSAAHLTFRNWMEQSLVSGSGSLIWIDLGTVILNCCIVTLFHSSLPAFSWDNWLGTDIGCHSDSKSKGPTYRANFVIVESVIWFICSISFWNMMWHTSYKSS